MKKHYKKVDEFFEAVKAPTIAVTTFSDVPVLESYLRLAVYLAHDTVHKNAQNPFKAGLEGGIQNVLNSFYTAP